MPHLRFRGVKAVVVQQLSESIHHELATLIGTPSENFTFELVQTQFFSQGVADGDYPFIEVLWFERGPEVKQAVASHLTDCVRKINGASDVAVVFRPLDRKDYFENGNHF